MKMNEEEKKAIDILQNCIADYVISAYCKECGDNKICNDRNEDCYFIQAIDDVLNLINKQQKEIENHTFNDKVVLETLKECVTKRSIRELIKEKAKTDTYNFKTIAVKDIEELLGE